MPDLIPPRSRTTAALLLALPGLAIGYGCAEGGRLASAPPRVFACEGGRGFAVELRPQRAILHAAGRTYALDRQISSFGARYVSGEAAFMEDGDSVVVVGAAGGPYRKCVRRVS